MKRTKSSALRHLGFALFTVAVSLAETVLLARLPVFGIRLTLMPSLAALIGAECGAEEGGIFGLAAGLFWVLAGAASEAVILTMTFGGVFGGYLCDAVLTRGLSAALLSSFVCLVTTMVVAGLLHAYLHGGEGSAVYLSALRAVVSLPLAAILYFPVRAIGRLGT